MIQVNRSQTLSLMLNVAEAVLSRGQMPAALLVVDRLPTATLE
jgi:hypothetical protein